MIEICCEIFELAYPDSEASMEEKFSFCAVEEFSAPGEDATNLSQFAQMSMYTSVDAP